ASKNISSFCIRECVCYAGLQVKRPCTTTSDAVCEPQDGFFCVDLRGDGCVAAQKHRSCKPGQYMSQRVGQECCPMCRPGYRVNKHCTEFTSTSCEPCTDGTFLDQPNGQTECFPCKKYDADAGLQVKSPCTTTSDAVFEPQDGFFCVDRGGDGCVAAQKHRSCKPGQCISHRGTATADTECSDCTGETYSNGTFTSCQPHRKCESEGLQQIRPGNHSADSECGPKHDSSNKTAITVSLILVVVITVAVLTAAVIWRRKKRPKQSAGRISI
uniref:TNFR-Cys domain-containing protein n=1 Tax=Myripristis murdjan TaxID=586833 RepID=A0A667WHC8_9TELE